MQKTRNLRKQVLSFGLSLVMAFPIIIGLGKSSTSYGAVSAPSVSVTYTSSDLSNKLTPQNNLTFANYDSSAGNQIYVNPDITYQDFQGFGSSFDGSSVYNLSQMTSSNRDSVMSSLFSPSTGANWNLMRICFGTCDFSSDSFYSYDDMPAGQTDETLANFSIQKDIDRNIISRVKDAIVKNPSLKIFATAWSPPAWMKDNGSLVNGGHVQRKYYNVLAKYYAKAIKAYQSNGIDIYAMTLQNEPTISTNYPSCLYSAEEERDFIKVLSNELRSQNISTKLWIYDDSFTDNTENGNCSMEYISTIMSDNAAAAVVDGIGFHDYSYNTARVIADCSTLSKIHKLYPTVPLYLTERSNYDINGADRIIQYFRNWIKSYSAWLTFLNDDGLPDQSWSGQWTPTCTPTGDPPGKNPPQPIRASASDINNWRLTREYYIYAQFSKYIQTGAVRIDSDAGSTSTVTNVAFKNPDGSIVMVAVNQNSTPQTIKILTSDGQAVNTIPANTVATFKWTPNTYTALKTDAWQVSASQTNSGDYTAHAIDSDASTRWTNGAAQTNGQYFQIDMQQQKKFDSVIIDAGPNSKDDYARGYIIRVSNDGIQWTPVATGTGKCRLIHAQFNSVTARYIRITQTGTAPGNWWSISEINVYSHDITAAYKALSTSIESVNYYMCSSSGAQVISAFDQNNGGVSAVQLSENSWTDYNINVETKGTYVFECRINSTQQGQLQLINNSNVLSTVIIPATGNNSWQIVDTEIYLAAGKNTLRIASHKGLFNIDNFSLFKNYTQLPVTGWKASAYKTNGSDVASNVIDGDIHTRWSNGEAQSNTSNTQWFELDMGVHQTLTSIDLDAGENIGDMGRHIDVYVSNDESTWGGSIASADITAQSTRFDFPPIDARYIKFVQTGSANDHYWSISEIKVYNTSASRILEKKDWVAKAYKSDAGDVASNVLDSNSSTRWSNGEAQSNTNNNQWFQIDMGRTMPFVKISVDSGSSIGDYARNCNVQVSGDGLHWASLVTNWDGTGQVMQLSCVPQNARYIKFIQTGTAGGNYWSIHEINVYGKESLKPIVESSWTHSQTGDKSIAKIDMGSMNAGISTNAINDILLYPDNIGVNIPSTYAVYISNDGNTFSNVIAQGNFTDHNVRITYQSKSSRYIEIVLTRPNQTTDLWGNYKFKLFNSEQLCAIPKDSWIASAYKTNGTDAPSKAIDNVLNTRWSNGEAQNPTQWFEIDMGKNYEFSMININSDFSTGDYPRGYSVYVSNDGTNWGSPVATGTCWNDDISINLSPQNARYIQIYQTGTAGDHYWSIHEMNVYSYRMYGVPALR